MNQDVLHLQPVVYLYLKVITLMDLHDLPLLAASTSAGCSSPQPVTTIIFQFGAPFCLEYLSF